MFKVVIRREADRERHGMTGWNSRRLIRPKAGKGARADGVLGQGSLLWCFNLEMDGMTRAAMCCQAVLVQIQPSSASTTPVFSTSSTPGHLVLVCIKMHLESIGTEARVMDLVVSVERGTQRSS